MLYKPATARFFMRLPAALTRFDSCEYGDDTSVSSQHCTRLEGVALSY
jgi:hypothetical protein